MAKGPTEKYTFLEKEDIPRARASLLFTLASLVILLVSLVAAYFLEGKAGIVLGAAGLAGALMAVYAFVIALIALARRESKFQFCVTAAICSGLMTIVWLTVFLNGLTAAGA